MTRPSLRLRLRLTLYYGALACVTGTILLTLTFGLVHRSLTADQAQLNRAVIGRVLSELVVEPGERTVFQGFLPGASQLSGRAFTAAQHSLIAEALERLRLQAALALGMVTFASLLVGWLIAGRMLRPINRITSTTQHLSEDTLHERIELTGPNDELKQLADSLDGLLARLDAAFAAQRDFVANASHELRTPLAIIRTELDVTLADPDATVEELRAMAETIRSAAQRSEKLVASLLLLARPEGPLVSGAPVDLADLVELALDDTEPAREDLGLRVTRELSSAPVRGDAVLLSRLVGNLIENAVIHNERGGWLSVESRMDDAHPQLRVANGGRAIAPEELEVLFHRFTRLDGPVRVRRAGFGLGLSIVEALAAAHQAVVRARALEPGGLEVVVRFAADQRPAEEAPQSPETPASAESLPAEEGRAVVVWPPRAPSHW
jgi:signal transduction histidine kinase